MFRRRSIKSNNSSNIIGHFVLGYDRCCPTGRKYILRAEALIKLALIGFQPWAEPSNPFGAAYTNLEAYL